ncbi:MAG TPA: phosphate ABC transporter permease subunit PstC [Natrialbaceae archaeon]|nr:phosphate ABC transporter permease subunit PstC [Natrialbaceae archaeon]
MSTEPTDADGMEPGFLTETAGNTTRERLVRAFFFVCAFLSVVTTFAIVFTLAFEAAKFFGVTGQLLGVSAEKTVAAVEFYTGFEWIPSRQLFGVLEFVSATLAIVVGSSIIALPFGLGTAIYLSEYANPRMRTYLKPALEVLAGIPTVVYGYFALVYITPALDGFFSAVSRTVPLLTIPDLGAFNLLSASIVVGIMIIPMVSSISEDAMSAVPDDLRQAGYGMGATKFDVSIGVVIPAAISGIFSSFILALSRAIGETMAVTIAAGQQPNLVNPLNPADYFDAAMPMTAGMVQIATGDIAGQGAEYQSLFAIGLTLFVITLAMNLISDVITERYREQYE